MALNAMLSQKFMMIQVIWCTFLSIVVPMFIAGSLRKDDGKRNLTNFLTVVIQPIFLYYNLSSAKLIRYKILKQNDISLAVEFKDITTKIKVMEDQLVMQHRVQVGTETVFQLAGNVILVCYAYSQTKTTQGLAALFQHDSVDIMSISISSKVVLVGDEFGDLHMGSLRWHCQRIWRKSQFDSKFFVDPMHCLLQLCQNNVNHTIFYPYTWTFQFASSLSRYS